MEQLRPPVAKNVRETSTAVAKQGLKVMFVAHPDSCRVCRGLQGRIFDPREAPPVPLEECLTPPCRCRYEWYDPQLVISKLLGAGVDAVKGKRLEEARDLLYQVIDLDEHNEKAWLWLSGVVEGIDGRIVCLENVLAINPGNGLAAEGLRYLRSERRARAAGEQTARKIRAARDAIDHIRSRRSKVIALRESPPVPGKPAQTPVVSRSVSRPRPVSPAVARPVARERAPTVSFTAIFLSVLLVAVLLVLMLAALMYVGNLLR
jgi:hypothetical protein